MCRVFIRNSITVLCVVVLELRGYPDGPAARFLPRPPHATVVKLQINIANTSFTAHDF